MLQFIWALFAYFVAAVGRRTDTADADGSLHGKLNALASVLGPIRNVILSGIDGDTTISTNADTPQTFMAYENLTINADRTLTVVQDSLYPSIVGVRGTLTLNGTLTCAPSPSGGTAPHADTGGAGGAAGGRVILVANTIVGTGSILLNGTNGQNAIHPGSSAQGDGGNGNQGSYIERVITAGGGATGTARGIGGVGTGYASELLQLPYILNLVRNFCPSSGGGGSAAANNGTISGHGGGGGACYGNGGNGGLATTSATCGAGGGGAGGMLFLFSANDVPAVSIAANGGNGGNGANKPATEHYGGAGGGGGGGLVIICAPNTTDTTTIAGGSLGTGGTQSGTESGNGIRVAVPTYI